MPLVLQNILLVFISLLTLGYVLFLLLLILYMASSLFVWPPSMPTDSKTRKAMIFLAKKYFNTEQNFRIADLGSGYGHLIKNFTKNFKNAHITGFEILRPPYFFTKKIFSNNKNISIIKGDFLNQNISDFDLIITFYKDMTNDNRLENKLKEECKTGSIVLSNNFEFPNLKAIEVFDVNIFASKRKIYVYKF